MAIETAPALDVTARLAEARPIMRLFSQFDSRGLDAYERVAALLFDALDQADENWIWALGWAVRQLVVLRDELGGRWLDPTHGAAVEAEIADLNARYR